MYTGWLGWPEKRIYLMGSEISEEFKTFFERIGCIVTWDCSLREGYWHEIYIDNELICQVDMNTPLSAFLEDLPLLAKGKDGTSSSNYTCNCDSDEKLERLQKKIESRKDM